MIYRFTDFELNTQSFQLVSGGRPVAIEPQVLDLLKYLIANRERLVSRDELFDKIWSGRVVSDTSLSNHIKSARKAIGDDGKNQRLIKTIHGRGYQFVAATDEVVNHGSDLASLPVDYSIRVSWAIHPRARSMSLPPSFTVIPAHAGILHSAHNGGCRGALTGSIARRPFPG